MLGGLAFLVSFSPKASNASLNPVVRSVYRHLRCSLVNYLPGCIPTFSSFVFPSSGLDHFQPFLEYKIRNYPSCSCPTQIVHSNIMFGSRKNRPPNPVRHLTAILLCLLCFSMMLVTFGALFWFWRCEHHFPDRQEDIVSPSLQHVLPLFSCYYSYICRLRTYYQPTPSELTSLP